MPSAQNTPVTLDSLSHEIKNLRQEGMTRTEILRELIRVEKKVDEALRILKTLAPQVPLQLLSHTGQTCPLCQNPVHYVPLPGGEGETRTVRVCGCEPAATQLVAGMRR